MITLYIDTSDQDVSIAIIKDNQILSSIIKTIPNQHSIYTVPFIQDTLTKSNLEPEDVDNIMVVSGPGSFTGLRIGITVAKVYAYLLKKELRTLSSLKTLALSTEGDYILSLIDAKHDNYYLGLYDREYHEVIPEQFANITTVTTLINKYHPQVVSNTNLTLDNISIEALKINIPQVVSYYLTTTPRNPHTVIPNYLKLPQVMETKHD